MQRNRSFRTNVLNNYKKKPSAVSNQLSYVDHDFISFLIVLGQIIEHFSGGTERPDMGEWGEGWLLSYAIFRRTEEGQLSDH